MRSIKLEGSFAVFSDVHGNLPALEAVLADTSLITNFAGPEAAAEAVRA